MKFLLLVLLITMVPTTVSAAGYTYSAALPVCPDVNNPWQSYADTEYQIGSQINAAVQAGNFAQAASLQQSFDNNVNAYAAAEGPCVSK
jgi:hypothetical protein